MFKYYLCQILSKDPPDGKNFRAKISEVIMQGDSLGPPCPYVPLFYQADPANNTSRNQTEVSDIAAVTVVDPEGFPRFPLKPSFW